MYYKTKSPYKNTYKYFFFSSNALIFGMVILNLFTYDFVMGQSITRKNNLESSFGRKLSNNLNERHNSYKRTKSQNKNKSKKGNQKAQFENSQKDQENNILRALDDRVGNR